VVVDNSETGFLFGIPQLNLIYTTETRFLLLGQKSDRWELRNRVSFWHSTVKFNLHHRNPVSFIGVKKARSPTTPETGFLPLSLGWVPKIIAETRFIFLGISIRYSLYPDLNKDGF